MTAESPINSPLQAGNAAMILWRGTLEPYSWRAGEEVKLVYDSHSSDRARQREIAVRAFLRGSDVRTISTGTRIDEIDLNVSFRSARKKFLSGSEDVVSGAMHYEPAKTFGVFAFREHLLIRLEVPELLFDDLWSRLTSRTPPPTAIHFAAERSKAVADGVWDIDKESDRTLQVLAAEFTYEWCADIDRVHHFVKADRTRLVKDGVIDWLKDLGIARDSRYEPARQLAEKIESESLNNSHFGPAVSIAVELGRSAAIEALKRDLSEDAARSRIYSDCRIVSSLLAALNRGEAVNERWEERDKRILQTLADEKLHNLKNPEYYFYHGQLEEVIDTNTLLHAVAEYVRRPWLNSPLFERYATWAYLLQASVKLGEEAKQGSVSKGLWTYSASRGNLPKLSLYRTMISIGKWPVVIGLGALLYLWSNESPSVEWRQWVFLGYVAAGTLWVIARARSTVVYQDERKRSERYEEVLARLKLLEEKAFYALSPSDVRDHLLELGRLGVVMGAGARALVDKAVARCPYCWDPFENWD